MLGGGEFFNREDHTIKIVGLEEIQLGTHLQMELPWNICPYCGTPAAGMRRDAATSVDEALRGLKLEDDTEEIKTEEPKTE